MAKISVVLHDRETTSEVTYEADKWVIDDVGRLHIVGPAGNRASFNIAQWVSAEFVIPTRM